MYRVCLKIVLSFLTLVWTSTFARAEALAPVRLTLEGTGKAAIEQKYSWFEDKTEKLGIADVLQLAQTGHFKSILTEKIPFVFSSKPFWIQFDVINDAPSMQWYLAAPNSIIDRVEVYEITEGSHNPTWELQPLIPGKRYTVSKINIPPGTIKRFFVKFVTYDPPTTLFSIMNGPALSNRESEELPFYGVLAGTFLALIFYNIFLYFSLRRRIHLYYVLFAICNTYIALFSVNIPIGITSTFSLFDWGHFLRFMAPLSTIIFAQTFLDTRRIFPRLHYSLYGVLAVYALLLLYQLITGDKRPLNEVVDLLMLSTIILVTVAGISAYCKGNTSAKYFLMAVGSFFIGVIVQAVHPLLGLPTNVYTESAHLIGQAGEMILMSLALASLIKILEEEKVRAEATALTKSKLLRVMSHDIMNPLALIKGFSQLMIRKPNEIDHLEKITRSATMIENIVNFVVRYESSRGEHPLRLEPVSVKAVFDELAFLFQKASMEKGVKVSFEIDQDDLLVAAEKVSLTNEILANLISNAIKFSFVGSTVEVKATAAQDTVRMFVKDTGVGIPKATLANIFNPSANISRQGTSGELGSGFGMPIVWSFVKELGGEIIVDSISFDEDKEHCGTVVSITLKRAKGNPKGTTEAITMARKQ